MWPHVATLIIFSIKKLFCQFTVAILAAKAIMLIEVVFLADARCGFSFVVAPIRAPQGGSQLGSDDGDVGGGRLTVVSHERPAGCHTLRRSRIYTYTNFIYGPAEIPQTLPSTSHSRRTPASRTHPGALTLHPLLRCSHRACGFVPNKSAHGRMAWHALRSL